MINSKLAKIYKLKLQSLLKTIDTKKINNLCEIIKETSQKENNIFMFGNGGSSSTANHFANDMTKNAKIKTLSFSNDNLASNTAGFDCKTRITLPVQQPQVIP